MQLNIVKSNKLYINIIYNQLKKNKDFNITEITSPNNLQDSTFLIIDYSDFDIYSYIIEKKSIPTLLISEKNTLQHNQINKSFIYKTPETINHIINYLYQLRLNKKTKILLIDDNKQSIQKKEKYLNSQFYQILSVENPISALEIYEQNKDINILISKDKLPLLRGMELLKIIRRSISKNRLGFIAISDSSKMSDFFDYGANDFIVEDLSKDEFLYRVNNLTNMLNHIAKLEDSSNKDFLTGLSNRKYFFTLASKIYDKKSNFALAMIDIDNFKNINDTYGHKTGDKVIKALSNLMKNSIKGKDIVARMGGEEFIILLQDIKTLNAINFLNKLCKDTSKINIDGINFTISIGLTTKKSNSLDAMINEADKFLYKAKENGKNQVMSDMNVFS